MSYPISVNLISGLPKKPFRKGASAYEGIVNHSTATPEATAAAERNYEAAHWSNAFVHFFVDWTSIIQVADTNYQAWGAGPNANPRFVHIELCETADPGKFAESYKRYVWLTAKLLKDKNLGVSDGGTLVSHAWVTKNLGGTTHTDPIVYLQSHGISWAQHVANVAAEYNGQAAPAPQPLQQSTPSGYVKRDGWVEIIASNLNVRKGPGTNFAVIRQLGPDEKHFPFCGVQNGWYDLGGQWIFSNNGSYAKECIPPSQPAPAPIQHKVGDTVTLQGFATNYASGQGIPDYVKNKQYKIVQVKPWARDKSKVAYLLSGIMSWVLEQDVR
jgi:N-acetylmuramoyl-L-alanine amidase